MVSLLAETLILIEQAWRPQLWMTNQPPPEPHMPNPSSEVYTFLLTDIADSTHLWEQHPTDREAILARQAALLRAAFGAEGGRVCKTEGDLFCAAFATTPAAVRAATAAQRALHGADWTPLA